MAKLGKLKTEKVKDCRVDIILHFVPGPGFFLILFRFHPG